VTASEFAFLALGLVLGAACGAALVEVLRSRPSSRREVRITVAPNSIPRRASTLAESDSTDSGPARGGPADRRWVDRDLPPADDPEPEPTASPLDPAVPVVSGDAPKSTTPTNRTAVPTGASQPPFRLTTTAGVPVGGNAVAPPKPPVGIPIAREEDPMVTALRATAAASATAAMKQGGARPPAGTASAATTPASASGDPGTSSPPEAGDEEGGDGTPEGNSR
jgi:hypothetical protein